MSLAWTAALAALGLFGGMLAAFRSGTRLSKNTGLQVNRAGVVESAVFGLLGLLIAFTFSGAASRFEARRHLITQEANAIGTAYQRLDLLPEDARPALRQLMQRYLDLRIGTYHQADDLSATAARLADSAALQRQIWAKAVSGCRQPEAPVSAAMLLLPALNDMIDITTTRTVATRNHPPLVIFFLLAGLSLLSALLAGHALGSDRDWFHPLILAATLSLTFYVILDLEYPRLGLIRVDAADATLVELRSSIR